MRPPGLAALPAALALCGLLAAPAGAKTKIDSRWLDREIRIDGELDEWRDALSFVKSVDAYVGAFNDASSLYLCLYSQNPQVSQQLFTDGVRARLETDAGAFVVRHPGGDGMVLEVSVPGRRDAVSVAASGEAGIEARVSQRGSYVFELRVPLAADETHAWAPALSPGDRFQLVLVNPQIDALSEDRAREENRGTGTGSPFDPRMGDPYDPSWSGRAPRPDEAHLRQAFLFLLKARVDLAGDPRRLD